MSRKPDSVRTTRRRARAADHPSRLTEALGRLVGILDEAAEENGWGSPPALVAIMSWPDDADRLDDFAFDFGLRPLDDGMGVVEALAGFEAPSEWAAIGVVTEGNARHLVDPTIERRRVRCVHLVDRSGACASSIRLQGDEPLSLNGNPPPEGRVDDVCRRALGLATAPPDRSTLELWAHVWLERIIEWVDCCGPHVTWVDVATLHPAAAVLVADDDEWERDAADNLARLGSILADVRSWPVLRAECAAGNWANDEVPTDVAEWLDDGAFSRWVLGGYPPFEPLATAVADAMPPSVRRRFHTVLTTWGLPHPAI
jgi:hypothetical protein